MKKSVTGREVMETQKSGKINSYLVTIWCYCCNINKKIARDCVAKDKLGGYEFTKEDIKHDVERKEAGKVKQD